VAPRWQLYVQHKIAQQFTRDEWHYLNMEIGIKSMLETPVTGVLGATYNPETYSHILQQTNNEASLGVVDHSLSSSSTRSLKGTMPRGLLISPADEGSASTWLRKLMVNQPCCNGVPVQPKHINVLCRCHRFQTSVATIMLWHCIILSIFANVLRWCCVQQTSVATNMLWYCITYSAYTQMCCDSVVNSKPASQPTCCGICIVFSIYANVL